MTLAVAQIEAAKPFEVMVAGVRLLLDCSGVAFMPEDRILIVSDLHLEKGAAFARKRRFLPPYDTRDTLIRLASAIEVYRPQTVVSLGDSFHRHDSADHLADGDRSLLLSVVSMQDWIWIAGNHDPDAPADLPGSSVMELTAGGLVLRHEPQHGSAAGEISGHLHPGARVVSKGRSVRRPCFATDGKRLVMPSFGSFTGCLNVLDDAFATLFEKGALSACMLGEGRVHPVPAKRLWPD